MIYRRLKPDNQNKKINNKKRELANKKDNTIQKSSCQSDANTQAHDGVNKSLIHFGTKPFKVLKFNNKYQ